MDDKRMPLVMIALMALAALAVLVVGFVIGVENGNTTRNDTAKTCIANGGTWLDGTTCIP